MRVIALQMDVVWENKGKNFETLERLLARAAPGRDALVILPEMFATGFSMNTEVIAEDYGGETEQFLARTAKKHLVWLIAGAAMRGHDGKTRNKALVFSPDGRLAAYYAKMRPFSVGGEVDHYLAGEKPVTFKWGECTVSPFVCYDLRFPELFRKAAAAGRPELFVVIANWPAKRIQHWVRLLRARAIENQAYVAAVNRIGKDPHFDYCGRSLIIDPHGEIVADARDREGAISATLDLGTLRKYREGLPFLDDLAL